MAKVSVRLVLSLAILGLAARGLLTCCGPQTYWHGRCAAAQHLLTQLQLAVESYELAYGEYPPGDGRGTRELMRILRRPRHRGCGWFEPAEQTIEGDLPNPMLPGEPAPDGVVHYRRYPPGSRPPFRIFMSDGRGGELSAP